MPKIYRIYTIRLAKDAAKENCIVGETVEMPKRGQIFRLYNQRQKKAPPEQVGDIPETDFLESIETKIPKKSFRVVALKVLSHWEYIVRTDTDEELYLDVIQKERIINDTFKHVSKHPSFRSGNVFHGSGSFPGKNGKRNKKKQ